ncbi:armadillo-type protein [Achaetomium macrosporum]|uniref:Armadillo-type protein n=1 Tax=Achaetomium macrosporum TaxID=79813 RepID=A0AAN7CBS4_9PEZI|nr:armadillo-type protein [Achaetomium macrosporum]
MATTIPSNPTPQTVQQLLSKINDPDPDFRFMALDDLLKVFTIANPNFMNHDYGAAARTVDHVVGALDDQNGEVQNQAIKCLGPLVKKIAPQLIAPMIEKLCGFKVKNSLDNSIPSLAIRAVVEALPRPVPGVAPTKEVSEAYASISRVLIPRLIGRATSAGQLLPALLDPEDPNSDSVDVLIDAVRCFGPLLQSVEIEALHNAVVAILEKDKGNSVVKKRAVVAVSMLAHYLPDAPLNAFVKRIAGILNQPGLKDTTRRLYITILGSMARSIPYRFGLHLAELAPLVLRVLSEEELQAQIDEISEGGGAALEFNEVREAALVALEAFLSSCPTPMRLFTNEAIEACIRYLKFDPNYAVDEDEEMDDEEEEEDELDEDDEFEAVGGFDDDDDASWKVRRCAAKALHTIISTRSSGDLLDSGVLYGTVAPALVKRFGEREENVRLEVLSAMALLVRKTGEGVLPGFALDASHGDYLSQQPPTRKRRRQSSVAGTMVSSHLSGAGLTSPTTKVPATGPRAELAALTPAIIKPMTKLLKGKLISTRQACICLLDDMVCAQTGGLESYFDQIIGPILDAIKPSSAASTSASLSSAGGNASATATTLRLAALRLTSDIAKNHSSAVLQPYLPKIVVGIVAVARDRFYKISAETIQTAEEVIKAITPPRSRATAQQFKGELQKLYDVVIDRATANDADAEVRRKAIHALGTLLARTTGAEGSALLPDDKRKASLVCLLERLKNETTRLAAVRAVDTAAAMSADAVQFETQWTRQVVVELASQLRKSNRALRGSSIMTLKHLILSPAAKGTLDKTTVQNVVAALIKVITNNDVQLLGPGLSVLARLTQEMPDTVVTPELIESLCRLLQTAITGSVLESLLALVTQAGQTGQGKPLMGALLKDVGVGGDPSVVGKVIGTLLVASGDSAGVTLNDFVREVEVGANFGDQARSSLALAVIGEAGLRLGSSFPIPPTLFLERFTNEYDKVSLSAAVALGRAGAGNVAVYLPVILQSMTQGGGKQYLLLQSIKEILQQAAVSSTDIGQYSTSLWEQILAASGAEDNKAVCAECIGRMVIIDPKTYMVKLESLFRDESRVLRDIAVQALRYTLPDDNETFDALLRNSLVDMLKTAMSDPDLEIRRHSMSTLTSAAHNKPELFLAQLNQLMPFVMSETVIKPELVREVQMGPFKHIIDDGLEVRKAAYETLYALIDTAFSRMSIIDLYDRIVAGLSDDNDIRALCNLMVAKLIHLDPDETIRRLDSIADGFRKTLSHKLKDTAVKQEIEKQDEANKAVLRLTLLLGDKLNKSALNTGGGGAGGAGAGSSPAWTSYWEWVNRDFASQLKSIRDESRDAGTDS